MLMVVIATRFWGAFHFIFVTFYIIEFFFLTMGLH